MVETVAILISHGLLIYAILKYIIVRRNGDV